MLEAAEARIVVDNDDLFSGDEATLHLAPDSTSDGGLAELRAAAFGIGLTADACRPIARNRLR